MAAAHTQPPLEVEDQLPEVEPPPPGMEEATMEPLPRKKRADESKSTGQRKMRQKVERTKQQLSDAANCPKGLDERQKQMAQDALAEANAKRAADAPVTPDEDEQAVEVFRDMLDPADPLSGQAGALRASEQWLPTRAQLAKARDPTAAFDAELEEKRERALAYVLDRQHANARAIQRREPPPYEIPKELLEFAQPAAARTHNGEGVPVASDKDFIDHNMYGDKGLARSWSAPKVTGRGALDFNKYGCQFRCQG